MRNIKTKQTIYIYISYVIYKVMWKNDVVVSCFIVQKNVNFALIAREPLQSTFYSNNKSNRESNRASQNIQDTNCNMNSEENSTVQAKTHDDTA
jgi:hypothetical protein